jgi:hypothetical protein
MGPKSSKRQVTGLSRQNGVLYVSRRNVDLRIDCQISKSWSRECRLIRGLLYHEIPSKAGPALPFSHI